MCTRGRVPGCEPLFMTETFVPRTKAVSPSDSHPEALQFKSRCFPLLSVVPISNTNTIIDSQLPTTAI